MARPPRGMLFRRLAALVVFFAALLAARTSRADGEGLESALKGLSQPAGDDVAIAIRAIVATGDPRALAILEALRDGNLVVSDAGRAYLRDPSGAKS